MFRTDRGRTYDRSRPNRSKRQKSACHGGPSTYDDLRADLDQFLLERRHRPVFDRLGRRQRAQEVAEIVSERVKLETDSIGGEGTARQARPLDRPFALLDPYVDGPLLASCWAVL